MELAFKQIVTIVIAIVVVTLVVIFVLGKIGAEGSITETVLGMLSSAEGGLD